MAEIVEQNLDLESILATLASLQQPGSLPPPDQAYDPNQVYRSFHDVPQTHTSQQNSPYQQPVDPRLATRPAPQHRPEPRRPQDRASTSLIDPSTITEWKQGLRCVSKIAAQNPSFGVSVRKVNSRVICLKRLHADELLADERPRGQRQAMVGYRGWLRRAYVLRQSREAGRTLLIDDQKLKKENEETNRAVLYVARMIELTLG
jgi:hypothetical protein